jgi:regulator of replication initiation timing
VKKMSSNKNEQCYNDFVSKIIIVIEGKKVHLSSESTSLADFGVHISQLNLIDKEGNHMISQIQQPITEYKRVIPKNIHKEILDLSSESTSLADFGVHISQLNLIDKEGNHMISQIQQPITEYKRVIPKNIHKEILDGNSNFVLVDRKEFEDLKARVEFLEKENVELRRENAELRKQVLELQRENAELRKQVITLQNVCDKYFNLYGPLPAN